MGFYEIYKDLCNTVNKSPSALALEIGLSKVAVNKWKNGNRPNSETLEKLADYFSVSTDYLLGRQERKISSAEQELLNIFSEIPKEKQQAFINLLKSQIELMK